MTTNQTSDAQKANKEEPAKRGVRRQYRLRKRQEDVAATRQRIVEAAMELHGTVGPKDTTFSAVAELAGVQRSTVYRHFPDEAALFAGCTTHWASLHPAPDPGSWRTIAGPAARVRHGLRETYRWYFENEQMLANAYRDIDLLPAFVVENNAAEAAAMQEALLDAWPPEERPRVAPAMAFAVDFRTAQALKAAGFDADSGAELMTRLVGAG